MHPDLSAHLHTEECNILITQLKQCHEESKYSKFMGACSSIDSKLIKCLKKEREQKRATNNANYRRRKEREEAAAKLS